MKERIYQTTIIVLTVMLFSVWQAYAGDPAGPGTPPDSTSSYTLNDIYARLEAGTAGTQSTFTEPSVAPGTSTTYTLNEIMTKAPIVDDTDGATVASVESGKTFWGLTSGEWALQTGTASLGGGGGGSASVPKTGQTTCYDASGSVISCTGTGQDGELQLGVAWPTPRFTDNSDGTVTDNLTGLIWLTNANCFGTQTWANALSSANGLANGACGLTDSSSAGDWRLPNVRELQSLIDYGFTSAALPNTAGTGQWSEGDPFTAVQTSSYWSSSTYSVIPTVGWFVNLYDGNLGAYVKTSPEYVWPVRGGQ